MSLPLLNDHPKFKNFVLEKVMTDKKKYKVTSDKNIQTHVYNDCLDVTPYSLQN